MDEELRAERLREAQNIQAQEALEEESEEDTIAAVQISQPMSLFWGLTFAFFMLIFFDIPQIILLFYGVGIVLNYLIGLVGWLIIGIWFFLTGQSLRGGREGTRVLQRFIGNILGETFTAGLWPGFTMLIVFTIMKERALTFAQKHPELTKKLIDKAGDLE